MKKFINNKKKLSTFYFPLATCFLLLVGVFVVYKHFSSTSQPIASSKYIFLDNPTTYKGVLGLPFPINTTIVKSGSSYQNTTNRFKTYFKSDPTIKDGITFKNDTSQISFYTPVNQSFGQLQSTTPKTKGSTITYPNLFSSLDLRYIVSSTRLLEEFVVNDKETAEKILSITQNATLTNVDNYSESGGAVNFFKNGKVTFSLPQPVLYEQENRDIYSHGIEYQVTGKDKDNLEVTKKITQEGADWLADPTRQYPIIIDLVIDNADTAGNWVSSDPSGLTVSQETTIKHEGTGSVKLTAGGISIGTGVDGNVTVSTGAPTYTINSHNYITGRTCADGGDAVNYSITALTSTSATVTGGGGTNGGPATGCLAIGDEILLINLQGTSTNYANVGNYETLNVSSITSGDVINFTTAKTNYYGNGATDDTNIGTAGSNQRVMLQRVPNYNNITVNTGITLSPTAWNGTKGGVMAFRASGNAIITGTISANALGYAAGAKPSSGGGPAGESFCGNPGGGNGGTYNGSNGQNGTCGGGGGEATGGSAWGIGSATGGAGGGGGDGAGSTYAGGGGGGGGGYGTYGTHGQGGNTIGSPPTNGGNGVSGNGGMANNGGGGGGGGGSFGSANLSTLFLGSGGGAGAVGGGSAAAGGNGGGIILIFANSLSVTTGITSNGDTGGNGSGSSSFYGGAGGGGSGGSIKIIGNSLAIGSGKVTATGGSGGTTASSSGAGGGGGSGIIAMYYSSLSGSTSSPTPTSNTYPYALNDTVKLTKSPAVDLSNVKYITFWVRSNQASQAMIFEFGINTPSEQTYSFTTDSSPNTWDQKTWDISGISAGSRSAVQYFAFKVTSISNNSTLIYFDDVEDNSPPNAPSIGPPSNTATDQILSPTFTTSTTDVDGDAVKYQIAICANSDMVTGCISGSPFSQTLSPTGWSNGSTPYASSATATYILQTTLLPGTIYYWQAQAIDPGGSGIYGAWSSVYSFTTSYVPSAPVVNYPSNGANGWPQAPAVSMHATDADSDYLRYQVKICTTSDMSTSCISGSPFTEPSGSPQTGWTGQDAQSSTAYASTPSSGTPFVFSPTLTAGTTYYWQARAIDPGGSNTYGSWSSIYTFTMGQVNVPYSLQVDGTVNPPALTDQTPNFTAICSSANSGDTFNQYQIQVSTDPNFGSTVYNPGALSMASCTVGSRTANLPYVGTLALDGTTYYWRVKLYDSTSASWSGWSTEFATFKMNSAYNGTPTSCRLMQAADGSSLTLLWTDMTSNETGFEIQKNVGNTSFSPLTTTAANVTSYSDPTATGTTYQYRVRADFPSGSPTDWCTTTITNLTKGTLQMQGVILSN